jgi:hypothetical protein
MAITNTWSVTDMTHVDADGGVVKAYWSCTAGNVTGQDPSGADQYDYTAVEGGKLICTYDASAAGYIAYADLTEADVLGWIWTSLIEGEETAEEAKARIEADRTAKIQKQIDAAETTASGTPW